MTSDLLSIKEAAPLLGRQHRSVRDICIDGRLRHLQDKSGRYWTTREWISEFLGAPIGGAVHSAVQESRK